MNVVVVGGGPAGLAVSLLLAESDKISSIQTYERRLEETKQNARAVVYGISLRGRRCLEALGVQLPKAGDGGRWHRGMAATEAVCVHIHEGKGRVTTSATVATSTLVERSAIISHLEHLTQKKHPHKISLHKGYKLDSIDFIAKRATFATDCGGQHVAPYDLIIGADGCFSRVRSEIARVDPGMTFTVVPNERGYKSCSGLPVPEDLDMGSSTGVKIHFFSSSRITPHNLVLWPSVDGTVSGTHLGQADWFEANKPTEQGYQEALGTWFPTLPHVLKDPIAKMLAESKAYSRAGAMVECSKLHGPCAVLIGDAAHGVTPSLGQGTNAALESALIFSKVLNASPTIDRAVEQFTAARLPDAHALHQLDLNAKARMGQEGMLKWTFWAATFHKRSQAVLKRLHSAGDFGPDYRDLSTSKYSYSQVHRALMRDSMILAGLLSATAAALVAVGVVFRRR